MFFVKKSKFKKTTKWFFLFGFILFGFVPFLSFGYTLLQPLPSRDGGELTENVSLSEYFSWVFEFGLAITAFLAVLMITVGGITYMASGGNESLVTKGKGYITNALYGLLLAFGSYLLLYTINPQLVSFEFLDDFEDNFSNKNEYNDTEIDDSGGSGNMIVSNEITTEKYTNSEGQEITKETTTWTYEDGSESTMVSEKYTDSNGDYYTTETTQNEDGSFSVKEMVEYSDGGYKIYIDGVEQTAEIDYDGVEDPAGELRNWDGS